MSESMNSLKQNYEFMRAYRRGRSFVHPALVLYIFKNKTKKNRVGITTSKKIGKAVQRNRARRIIRASYCNNQQFLQNGYDFVFVARGKTPYMKSTDLTKVMYKLFEKANMLK